MCIITNIEQTEAFAPVLQLARIAAGSVIFICIAAGFLGVFLTKTISRPLMLLAKGAGEIGRGNLEYRINIKRNDELGDLASAINEIAARIKETYTSIKNLEKEITERKLIEEFSRQSENRYRILFNEAPAMYVITSDKEGTPIIED